MKRKMMIRICAAAGAALLLAGCGGGTLKDGTYTAQSSMYESLEDEEDEGGEGYGIVSITVKDNTITACEFTTYMPDGTVKDEEYGKKNGEIANQDYYNKAPKNKSRRKCISYMSSMWIYYLFRRNHIKKRTLL